MAEVTLYIGNKNYSSWSLRGWLMLKESGLAFDEVLIPLDQPNTKTELLRLSPSGRVPALKHGELTVWDSLAIGEYLAEICPEKQLWPADPAARVEAFLPNMERMAKLAPQSIVVITGVATLCQIVRLMRAISVR